MNYKNDKLSFLDQIVLATGVEYDPNATIEDKGTFNDGIPSNYDYVNELKQHGMLKDDAISLLSKKKNIDWDYVKRLNEHVRNKYDKEDDVEKKHQQEIQRYKDAIKLLIQIANE